MKKILFVFMTLALTITLAACQDKKEDEQTTATTGTSATETSTEATSDTTPADVLKPMLKGLTAVTINQGEDFDKMAGVTAEDAVDGDLTSQIVVTGDFDKDVPNIYTLTYTVSDAAGNTKITSRSVKVIPIPDGTLQNGDFAFGALISWGTYAGEGGVGTLTTNSDGVAVFDVTTAGTLEWNVQLEQTKLHVEEGKFYRFTFEAKADTPRLINAKFENASTYNLFGYRVISLTTEMTEYEFFATVTETIEVGKLGIMLGNVLGDDTATKVYFDNFTMEEVAETDLVDYNPPTIVGATNDTLVAGVAFDPLAGVTATDDFDGAIALTSANVIENTVNINVAGTYTVKYELSDLAGNTEVYTRTIEVVEVNFVPTTEVVNGDFSTDALVPAVDDTITQTGWVHWHQDWEPFASATYTVVNGEMVIDIENMGTSGESWGIQFFQNGVTLEQGKVYKLQFDARADAARNVTAELIGQKQFSLTDTTDTYEFIFKMDGASGDFKLNFLLSFQGAAAGNNLYFDNIVLYEGQPVE